ncbi:NADP oxidoreductase [Prauserella sp. PE36]|uniref:ferredoxin--NADP(+) reductase n=1 Tax=Prauserella endophytica TaxID=1592324 RepID=A0ABY2RZ30_9PSEU|nr:MULTISPECIES: FAD-dependent oxidoreductase [Prauserella]RBM21717.1 NADP oxidoreductase [Prauserella sp. PE36]TKG65767.1 NADP oxidoreductase [Prauserella endophytica]
MTRIAVVGAGPSGVFTAAALLDRPDVLVDVYDRSPTPFGLVRYGVAPDHLKIKSVTRVLSRTLSDPRVRFLGNVEIGKDVRLDTLRGRYAAVVVAVGAPGTRRLAIPGEDLPGHVPAGDLVDWYNGRPGARYRPAERRRVAVIGAGNVALDIARILLRGGRGLSHTDVPEHVLRDLDARPTHEVHMLVRRGPADTRFTPAELAEFESLPDLDLRVDPAVLPTDDPGPSVADRALAARLAIFRRWSCAPRGAGRSLTIRFHSPPAAFRGAGRVEAVALPGPTLLPVDLAVSAIGFRGRPLPGLPFDDATATVPHEKGRVAPGLYVTGWIKRGPTGVIGANKACAQETAETLLADVPPDDNDDHDPAPTTGLRVVTWPGWLGIDRAETALGATHGRNRTTIHELDRLVRIGTATGDRLP